MPDPVKPIAVETQIAKPILETKPAVVEPITSTKPAVAGPTDGELISVQPVRRFRRDIADAATEVGPDSAAFMVPRGRAAQLRANGLVAYASDDDEEAHATAAEKAAGQEARKRFEAGRPRTKPIA